MQNNNSLIENKHNYQRGKEGEKGYIGNMD